MSADLIAVLLLLLFVFATVLHAVDVWIRESERRDDVELVHDLAVPYVKAWDRDADTARRTAEVLARIQVARIDQGIGAMVDAVQKNQAQR